MVRWLQLHGNADVLVLSRISGLQDYKNSLRRKMGEDLDEFVCSRIRTDGSENWKVAFLNKEQMEDHDLELIIKSQNM